jgi:hypothetical protein
MSDFVNSALHDPVRTVSAPTPATSDENLRVVEALFAQGPVNSAVAHPDHHESHFPAHAIPPERALANQSSLPAGKPSGLERAAGALRFALPLVQRLLPLLDGKFDAAPSNAFSPPQQRAPEPPSVNLAPIQDGLADLRTQHRALRDQVAEQNASLKRVGDQLQQVREATDRNTLEQQELLEDLKKVGSKVNIIAFIALTLLGAAFALNVVFYLQFRHIIP